MFSLFGFGQKDKNESDKNDSNNQDGHGHPTSDGTSDGGTPKGSLAVKNFMGGTSYQNMNPIIRLRMISTSFIRGEAKQYYRESGSDKVNKNNAICGDGATMNGGVMSNKKLLPNLLFPEDLGKNSVEIFDQCLQEALDYDFAQTMKFAVELRKTFLMRKNPQCIMMEATFHPARAKFNQEHPRVYKNCLSDVIGRPDDMTEQLRYIVGKYGSKSKIPTCLKKVWAEELEKMPVYQLQKYKRFIPDLVRISHANGSLNQHLNDIIVSGKTSVEGVQKTWETLRSSNMKWIDILETLQWRMPHMAALRNFIPFAREVRDTELIQKYGEMLVAGVEHGKQFPFRYINAYRESKKHGIKKHVSGANWHPKTLRKVDQELVVQILENCLQESMKNYPKLDGDTLSLCDNSGSAWGTFASVYGSVCVADIANLSALFTAYNTTGRGVVGVFGDRLELYTVKKGESILSQYDEITQLGKTVGGSTENGIWIAFRNSFRAPAEMRFDNIFIYSDMQCGHGGLYGTNPKEYKQYLVKNGDPHIDVLKLVEEYRQKVNTNVNLFSIQVAGYDNNILPEHIYRGAILSGWTGNEVTYAKEIIDIWNTCTFV